MAEEQSASIQLLRTFAPLDGMKRENLAALAKKVSVRTLTRGRILFSQGDTDKRTVWLVSGLVEIDDGEHKPSVLRGGTPETRAAQGEQMFMMRQVMQSRGINFGGGFGGGGGRPPR